MSGGAEPTPTRAVEPKPKDQTAQIGKEADDAREEGKNNSAKEEPGEASQGQRVISFRELKKKEAENDPEKKVSEGQIEVS